MQALEKVEAQVRALVEHPFHVLKNLFSYRKVRYLGLAKNAAQLQTLFALAEQPEQSSRSSAESPYCARHRKRLLSGEVRT